MAIRYVKGDATRPEGEGPRAIIHVCNTVGGWGRGFVVALSRRWSVPEEHYREQARKNDLRLGTIQPVEVESRLWVINMIAQVGYGSRGLSEHREEAKSIPLRYEALQECLRKVAVFAREHKASVHAPRLGAGLAQGDWDKIADMIELELISNGVPVTVYDLS